MLIIIFCTKLITCKMNSTKFLTYSTMFGPQLLLQTLFLSLLSFEVFFIYLELCEDRNTIYVQ